MLSLWLLSHVNLLLNPVVINVTCSQIVSDLPPFWLSTGFSPPGPHERIPRFLSSNDMQQNMGLIGSLPSFGARREVRVDWLLDLISIRNQSGNFIDYRFDHLDDWIALLYQNNLRPGFILKGNPSKFFSTFDDRKQLILWWDLVKSISLHYIQKYGITYVSTWNFETWNPDNGDFDGIKVTEDGYMDYIESSFQGLLSAAMAAPSNSSFKLQLSGPGGTCLPIQSSPLCWAGIEKLLEKGKTSDKVKVSLSVQGDDLEEGSKETILDQEGKIIQEIRKRTSQRINVFNSKGDSEPNWAKPQGWKADATYAAKMVKNVANHVDHYFRPNKKNDNIFFTSMTMENAHLSYFPFQFNQRTLLARFQVNNTFPKYVRFVAKPSFVATGLMGLLGDHLLDSSVWTSESSNVSKTIKLIPTMAYDDARNEKVYSILAVNDGPVDSDGSARINLTLTFSFADVSETWKVARYSIDNFRTNPYKVWKEQGSRPYFTARVLSMMREKVGPIIDVPPTDLQTPSLETFDHQFRIDFDLPHPGVSLILLCSKSSNPPEQVTNLRGVPVSENEVLLLWSHSKSRCVRTFEIEYRPEENGEFQIINFGPIIFSSFHFLRPRANVTGEFRVREIDFFERKGIWSEIARN